MTGSPARTALLVASVVLAVMEIADGFRLELPYMAWAYAALMLIGAAWLWRSQGRGPVVLLGALHALELLLLVFVFRTAEQAPGPVLLTAFIVVTLAGTVAAVLALRGSAAGRRATA